VPVSPAPGLGDRESGVIRGQQVLTDVIGGDDSGAPAAGRFPIWVMTSDCEDSRVQTVSMAAGPVRNIGTETYGKDAIGSGVLFARRELAR
jgi:hypothetical protein